MEEAKNIRVLEEDELLIISVPEAQKDDVQDVLKHATKAKRFIVVSGYDLYVVKKREQIVVGEETEEIPGKGIVEDDKGQDNSDEEQLDESIEQS